MKRSSADLCYWCGDSATGSDHVFPRAFFEKPRPPLITVPACDRHNKHLELDEGYFRVFVLARAYPKGSATSLWRGAVRRELARKPRLKSLLASQVRDVSLQSPAGIYLGEATALLAESSRIDRVLEKMVRGLYLHHAGNRLGDVQLRNFFISPLTTSRLVDLKPVLNSPTHEVGRAVTYRYGIAADIPAFSFWVLRFYERAIFVVATEPRSLQSSSKSPNLADESA